MAKKKVVQVIKLQVQGGSATPGPPVGAILGSKGLKAMDFCRQFNERTKDQKGKLLPVIIYAYADRSFDFVVKKPPAAVLIKEALGLDKGSSQANREKVGVLTRQQVRDIATIKHEDTNAFTIESTMKSIEGTARNMGVTITD
jgi:large subunit ribosomal protein L11